MERLTFGLWLIAGLGNVVSAAVVIFLMLQARRMQRDLALAQKQLTLRVQALERTLSLLSPGSGRRDPNRPRLS